MTREELKRMSRTRLLETTMAAFRRCEELEKQLAEARQDAAARQIQIEEAGSLADASVRINGVLEAADAAAEEYLENIRRRQEETEAHCAAMVSRAKEESQAYWDEVYLRIRQYCQTSDSLQGLIEKLPTPEPSL